TPFPVSTRRRHFVPNSLPWISLAGPAATFRNLAPALSGGPFVDTAGPPRAQATHAPDAARIGPANPFLESPADAGTHAPNLQRLRQAGDARQDLVRISESTTKCGDCGEESAGDAKVSKIRGDSERVLRAQVPFYAR